VLAAGTTGDTRNAGSGGDAAGRRCTAKCRAGASRPRAKPARAGRHRSDTSADGGITSRNTCTYRGGRGCGHPGARRTGAETRAASRAEVP